VSLKENKCVIKTHIWQTLGELQQLSTRKALRCVRKKKSVFRKYRDKGHPAVKRANLEATNKLKKAKRKYEKKLADNIKHDTESFYAYARSKSKTKSQIER